MDVHDACILMCMRTTLGVDDTLVKAASHLTGVKEKVDTCVRKLRTCARDVKLSCD